MINEKKTVFNELDQKTLEAVLGLLKFKRGGSFYIPFQEKIKKTPFQIKVLSELFKMTEFPSTTTRKDLSLLLGIPQRSIQVWFQNSRQAKRKLKGMFPEEYSENTNTETENDDVSLAEIWNIISTIKRRSKTK